MTRRGVKRPAVRVRRELEEYTLGSPLREGAGAKRLRGAPQQPPTTASSPIVPPAGFPERKKDKPAACLFIVSASDCALNLVGTQASCTNINMARSTVNDRLDALDVGLPCSVGPSVGMGDLDPERNALAANIALCHQLHLLAIESQLRLKTPTIIITELSEKSKHFFPFSAKKFPPPPRVYSSNSQCDRQREIFALSKTFFRRNTDVFQGKMVQRSVKRSTVRVRWELEEYTLRRQTLTFLPRRPSAES